MFTYPTPFELLEESETLLTSHPSLLLRAKSLSGKGFCGGARWMKEAQNLLRGEKAPLPKHRYEWYGFLKYGLALLIGTLLTFISYQVIPLGGALLVFVLSFYAVEAQFVFLFPLLVDGSENPIRESRTLTVKVGGTIQVVSTVLPIAFVMLFGGIFGKGFLRSWCRGCLSVLLWYENAVGKKAERPEGLTLFNRSNLSVRSIPSTEIGEEKILYISDLHLTRRNSAKILYEIRMAFSELSPSVTIFGGDLVDRPSGLAALNELTEGISQTTPVLAISGNHDHYIGEAKVRRTILESGGIWLADQSFSLSTSEGKIIFFTRESLEEAERVEAQNILRVYVGHDPKELKLIPKDLFHLAFFGHLHGGQAVLARFGQKLFPGALLYPENQLSFFHGTTKVYVSRGVTDTLPIRWNCPREVLICQM